MIPILVIILSTFFTIFLQTIFIIWPLLVLFIIDIDGFFIVVIASTTTHPHHHHVCPCCVVSVVLLIIMLSSSQFDDTALILASDNGHIDVVNTLIVHGADVNVENVVWAIK